MEVLLFPQDQCSMRNVERIIRFVGSARRTIDVAIYSLTLCPFANALVAARHAGIQLRVIVDYTQLRSNGSQAGKLVQAGVTV